MHARTRLHACSAESDQKDIMAVVWLTVSAAAPFRAYDDHRGDRTDDHRQRRAERASEELSQVGESILDLFP